MDFTQVILVDELDHPTGMMEKMEAHRQGVLHRAFSVFIFNPAGEMLLQQRALDKYHSGGLWTNACCSHPAPGESTPNAALRRLHEEMGFVTTIEKVFDFVYQARFGNGLTEYEFDHVFAGEYEGPVVCNPVEVMATGYKSMDRIRRELQELPGLYTAWFQLAFPKIDPWWQQRYGRSGDI